MSTETQSDMTAHELTKFQESLLIATGDLKQSGDHKHDSPHGLAIMEEIETSDYGPDEVHHGRLYPNLDTLEAHGLIIRTELDARTRGIELSDAGQQYLRTMGRRLLNAAPLPETGETTDATDEEWSA